MLERGYLTLARIRGVPVRFHWTVPVGAVLFGHFRFVPGFWLAFVLIVLVHELGHAAVVWAYRHRVLSIDVTGFGGLCSWTGSATPFERAAIAWGGVLAQLGLLGVALGLGAAGVFSALPGGADLASALVFTNLWLVALNLLPVPPLDGAEAWKIVGLLPGAYERWRLRRQGRDVWRQILAQPVPRRHVRRRVSAGPPPAPPPDAPPQGPATGATGAGPVNRELAELLKKVGDEARRARLGDRDK